jgi:hypothetical protein
MRRFTPVLILAAVVLLARPLLAAQPSSQQGLPPELTIADKPDYKTQLLTLQGLRTYTEQHKPSVGGGGLFSGFKTLFGGGAQQGMPVPPATLARNADQFRGKMVKVTGVFKQTRPDAGLIPFEGGSIRVSMPTGIQMDGL